MTEIYYICGGGESFAWIGHWLYFRDSTECSVVKAKNKVKEHVQNAWNISLRDCVQKARCRDGENGQIITIMKWQSATAGHSQ